MQTARQQPSSERHSVLRRIGSTNYRVGIHFNQNSNETLDDKILRMLKNDLQSPAENVNLNPLQAGWLPERSSI